MKLFWLMEQTNSLQVINIPMRNPQIVIDVIADFNSRYKTNFPVKSVEDRGGVEFVIVNTNEATIDNICALVGEEQQARSIYQCY